MNKTPTREKVKKVICKLFGHNRVFYDRRSNSWAWYACHRCERCGVEL